MDLRNLLVLCTAIANLFFGVFVYTKGKDKLTNIAYSVLAFNIFCWCAFLIPYRMSNFIDNAMIFCRALYVIPVFIVLSFVYFSYIFPEKKPINKVVIILSIIISFFLLYASIFTDHIVESIVFRSGQEKQIIFGKLYFAYVFLIPAGFLLGYYNLIKSIITNKGIIRAQAVYVFWGSFLASASGMVTNLILPTYGMFFLYWLGQVLTVQMVGFMAYAIIRHRLMDIRFALRQSFVYISSIVTIVLSALTLIYIFERIIGSSRPVEFSVWIFLLLFFSRIKKAYYRVANKYFFSSLYDGQEVISELSKKLSTLNLKTIYDSVYDSLSSSLHIKSFGVLQYNGKSKNYRVKYNKGFDIGRKRVFLGSLYLREEFVKTQRIIVVDELRRSQHKNKAQELMSIFSKYGVSVLIPLHIENKTIGVIALGPKESGDVYNNEDVKLLEIIGSAATIGIENALLYEDKLNFSIKLEEEIKKATKELRSANKKLTQLDKAKSEFISIASHQLRTPLTVIKGYISMILEENFGKVIKTQKEPLTKVSLSADRLIQLVENLLNISRIESGKIQFRYELVRIETIVDSVVDELIGKLEQKNLKIIYKKPKEPFPVLKIDNEKIRQVVMNLIDNAIKYTEVGTIKVYLERIGKKIRFCVEDSGMGIHDDDLPNLFKKFSRGKGTSVVHTEGTGLGLYVAKQMINAHNGKIWAESKGEGKGAKFCFELPIKKIK